MVSYEMIKQSAEYIKQKINIIPQVAIILGSGLSDYANELEDIIEIPYSQIPNFLTPTVDCHKAKIVFGKIKGKYVIILCGRFHCYEGYTMAQTAFPVQVLKEIGVKSLILSNSVGAINEDYNVGDLVVITDHIKLVSDSPLNGDNLNQIGDRFIDMSKAYTPKLIELVKEVAYGVDMALHEGVYAYMPGPSYETPAEVKMLKVLGADVVGMSTVPEVIAATHCKLDLLVISLVSNMACGVTTNEISHEEVILNAKQSLNDFTKLINTIIERLD